jgi:hypothetical protein
MRDAPVTLAKSNRPFHNLTVTTETGGESRPRVAEWYARVYRHGARFRVVVDGLIQFEVETLDGIGERTAREIVDHLRRFFPTRASPIGDPTAELDLSFDIAVEPSTPRSSWTRPRG